MLHGGGRFDGDVLAVSGGAAPGRLGLAETGDDVGSGYRRAVVELDEAQMELPEAMPGIGLPRRSQQRTRASLGVNLSQRFENQGGEAVTVVGIVVFGEWIERGDFVLKQNARGSPVTRARAAIGAGQRQEERASCS